jgi:hypothetical protein
MRANQGGQVAGCCFVFDAGCLFKPLSNEFGKRQKNSNLLYIVKPLPNLIYLLVEKNIKTYWVVIFLISMLAILLLIHKTDSNEDLVKEIGFAGTIISIILGVIAIFYSVVTNSQSTENFGKINESVGKIEEAINKVEKGARAIDELSKKIEEKMDKIPKHMEQLFKTYGEKGMDDRPILKKDFITDSEVQPDASTDEPDQE